MAYVFGFFFGKTPLIKLSPKKTWEGFIGGAFATVVFGIIVGILTILVECDSIFVIVYLILYATYEQKYKFDPFHISNLKMKLIIF